MKSTYIFSFLVFFVGAYQLTARADFSCRDMCAKQQVTCMGKCGTLTDTCKVNCQTTDYELCMDNCQNPPTPVVNGGLRCVFGLSYGNIVDYIDGYGETKDAACNSARTSCESALAYYMNQSPKTGSCWQEN